VDNDEIVKKWRDAIDKNENRIQWPKTVDEAIERASLELSEEDLEEFKNTLIRLSSIKRENLRICVCDPHDSPTKIVAPPIQSCEQNGTYLSIYQFISPDNKRVIEIAFIDKNNTSIYVANSPSEHHISKYNNTTIARIMIEGLWHQQWQLNIIKK
jgi:hypothetical protein